MKGTRVFVIGSNSFSGSNFVAKCINSGLDTWGISRSKEPNKVFLPYKWGSTFQKSENSNLFRFFQIDLNNGVILYHNNIIKTLNLI